MTPTATTRAGKPVGRVAFVGAGPGDPGLVTLRARDRLAAADTIVIDVRPPAEPRRACSRGSPDPTSTLVDAGHGEHGEELTRASRAKLLVRTAKALGGDGLVVRLLDGDPEPVQRVRRGGARPAQGGHPVRGRPRRQRRPPRSRCTPECRSRRSRPRPCTSSTPATAAHDWAPAVPDHVTVVVLGAPETLAPALGGLLAAGRAEDTPVLLTERGTTTQQVSRVTTLGEAEALLGATSVLFPSLAVVGPSVALRDELSWFETKPLFGWTVLLPRTKDQAGATSRAARRATAPRRRRAHHLGRAAAHAAADGKAVKGLVTGRYEWIGFTSVNAVRAVREKFEESGLDARAFAGLKVAAVGGVTADALREWGIDPDLVPAGEQSAAGLLEDWPAFDEVLDPINRVLLPRADIATETLVAGLREMGWEVDDVTAYRTVRAAPPAAAVRDAIKGGDYDAVLFTSSSTVRNLVGIAGKPHPQRSSRASDRPRPRRRRSTACGSTCSRPRPRPSASSTRSPVTASGSPSRRPRRASRSQRPSDKRPASRRARAAERRRR